MDSDFIKASLYYHKTAWSKYIFVAAGAAGLTTSPAICRNLSYEFIQHLQWVAQTIFTLQGQIDLLATLMLQNQCGLDLPTTERSLTLPLGRNVASVLTNQV